MRKIVIQNRREIAQFKTRAQVLIQALKLVNILTRRFLIVQYKNGSDWIGGSSDAATSSQLYLINSKIQGSRSNIEIVTCYYTSSGTINFISSSYAQTKLSMDVE
ncbi:Hypothetical_protein [Hexamita inflata]|uniref:Hypothetical_protein n=1 Tax=Hexamita inflata TaxID=28002 RepID=A0AA86Q2B9_9EUKA|nr:Hypothetical protein HINF_LOCUS31644 [Hexamita inflata]